MTSQTVEIRATAAPWWNGVELMVRKGDSFGTIEFEEIAPGAIPPVAARISMQEAQTLMDDLWRSGLRPTEGAGSAGAMRAVERHADDLRKIAFKSLGIDNGT